MLQRVSCFQKTLDERGRVAEDVLVKVFTAVYWLMKEELSNNKIKSLLQILEQVGMNDLKYFLYRSQDALREIFLTLGKTVQDTFLCKLKQAAHFGLLVDDVTDISVALQMISFAQFYNKSGGVVETGFLSINNLLEDSPSADPSTITNCIIETMDKFSLDSKKLASFVSDGASDMTCSRSGVATRLKELNPQLINFHCICHRLALACTDTLTSVSYISSVLKWLSQLSYMFQNSPKRKLK
ncbi:E3 SUMO-protein ligase KIAA1586-like [Oculina patagonica]